MFLCLAPPCAVQTRLVLQGRAAYPTSHSVALTARAAGSPVQPGALPARPLVSISASHCSLS